MRVAIIFNAADKSDDPSEQDVMRQVQLVGRALDRLGLTYIGIPMTGAIRPFLDELDRYRPDVVFNLVESVNGRDDLHANIPAVLELAGIPCTGTSARGLWLTTDKAAAKCIMQASGIPTPDFWVYPAGTPRLACKQDIRNHHKEKGRRLIQGPWIVKPATKDASIGIDEGAVFSSMDDLLKGLPARWEIFAPEPLLVELYINGREFNISMLEAPRGVECLPPAEIVFSNYPKGRPKILDWKAKWDTSALSYHNTARSFDFPAEDIQLLDELKHIATMCWHTFRLTGYARVDMRVDKANRPWVLEINANPCLSDDAGFMAAAREGGIQEDEAIERIIKAAIQA